MHMEVELWQLGSLMGAFLGLFIGTVKLLLMQIDRRLKERFDIQERMRIEGGERWSNQFDEVRENTQRIERDLYSLRAQLPNEYVRREDWIRFSGTIDMKLDKLAEKLDRLKGDNDE